MILFVILLMVLAIIAVIGAIGLSIGGAAFIVVFADVIVCVALIIWLIRKIFFKK